MTPSLSLVGARVWCGKRWHQPPESISLEELGSRESCKAKRGTLLLGMGAWVLSESTLESATLYVLSAQSPTPLEEVEAKPLVPPPPLAALNHLLHGICGTSRHRMARYLQGAWRAKSGADYSQAARRASID